jgi:predicted outer membrane lipoprotein
MRRLTRFSLGITLAFADGLLEGWLEMVERRRKETRHE